MNNTQTEQCTTQLLRVLIVEDDTKDQQEIISAIAGSDHLKYHISRSPDEVAKLSVEPKWDVCILDIKFNGKNRIDQLLPLVKRKWPAAICIILSHYISDFDRDNSLPVYEVIRKADFKSHPDKLVRVFNDAIDKCEDIDVVLRSKLCGHYENRLTSIVDEIEQEVLLEVEGYVIAYSPPYVEVSIRVPKAESGVLYLLTRFFTGDQPLYKRILMRHDVFKAAGIVDEDMAFVYRVVRDGSKIISEVVPLLDAAGNDLIGSTIHSTPELDRLEKIQNNLGKEISRE